MSLTLDPTLQTAQDSLTRKPLCEIVSGQFSDPLPFDGQYFNDDSTDEGNPFLITLSDGRLAAAYALHAGGSNETLRYLYTDTDRTYWTGITVNSTNYVVNGISLCELDNGNVGIVWFEDYSPGTGSDRLRRMVVSPTGSVVTAAANIDTYAESTYWVDHPNVVNLGSDEFMLLYAHNDINANDGSGEYSIMKRTSSGDFTSWGGEVAITIPGLEDTRRKDNPYYVQALSGENDVLLFDYVDDLREDEAEIVNIYKSESDDGAITFQSGEQVTTFDTFGYSAKAPSADFNASNNLMTAYHEEISVLHIGRGSTGTCGEDGAFCASAGITNLSWDSSTRYLYGSFIHDYVGTKALCSVVRINVDSWTIDKCYSSSSSPAFDTFWNNTHVWYNRDKSDGHWICFGTDGSSDRAVVAINDETETIKEYWFEDIPGYSKTKNIDVDMRGQETYATIGATAVDATNNRLYIYMVYASAYHNHEWFGYIDLTQEADPITGKYSWHEIFYQATSGIDLAAQAQLMMFSNMILVPELGYVVMTYGRLSTMNEGAVKIYSLSSGGQVKDYNNSDYSTMHLQGAYKPVYYDGHLYCGFEYEPDYGQSARRGLMDINISTDSIQYIVPSFASVDDYKLYGKCSTGDGRLFITTGDYGLQEFNINTQTWTEFSNTTVPGFTPDGHDDFCGATDVIYDGDGDTIYACRGYDPSYSWEGVLAINENGAWKRMRYQTGQWTTEWNFTGATNLTLETLDYNGSLTIDADNTIWLLWTRLDETEESIKWDKSGAFWTLSDYLTESVEVNWNVERPNQLSFSCSHGHLFDPNNDMSILSIYLARGRKITLRFGELVSDIEYWQNQGTFIIKESALTYQRGEYPIINVQCEDVTELWSEGSHAATEYYDDAHPENILVDLVEDFGNLTVGEYDIPAQGTMSNSHKIYHQWLDASLMDMLQELLDHFGYISNVNMDGEWSVKEIDFDKSPDHTYSDNTKIISYSPDNSYSSYVNKIVVKGEGRYFMEIIYGEEVVGQIQGTTGWWGCKETERVWYSEDRSKVVSDPRLVEVEGMSSNSFFSDWFGDISAYISDTDTTNRLWVEVTVDVESLVEALVLLIAAAVAIALAAFWCDALSGIPIIGSIFSFISGSKCGYFIMMLGFSLEAISLLLSVIQNYYFEIWGRPVGFEKQTFQAQAEDTDLQQELNGLVVTEEIDDPFCYTVAECTRVALQELAVVMAQRRRAKFTKLAHLQDEITDMIQVQHPYSLNNIKLIITNLRRIYTPATEPDGDGSFIDEIEGWRVAT